MHKLHVFFTIFSVKITYIGPIKISRAPVLYVWRDLLSLYFVGVSAVQLRQVVTLHAEA